MSRRITEQWRESRLEAAEMKFWFYFYQRPRYRALYAHDARLTNTTIQVFEFNELRFLIMNYGQYLVTDHWKALRFMKMKQAGFKCEKCKSDENIQVHHLRYRDLFDVQLSDLQCLCRNCHQRAHGLAGATDPLLAKLQSYARKAPKGGAKGRRNWCAKQLKREFREKGTLLKQTEERIDAMKKMILR